MSNRIVDTHSVETEQAWASGGRIYQRKIEPIRGAEQVQVAQTIKTIVPGGTVESEVAANPGDWIVTGSKGERFVLTNGKFMGLYTQQADGSWLPQKRQIVAVKNPHSEAISIIAPWSKPEKPEYQHGDANCMLVVGLDKNGSMTDDRYIIGSEEMLLNNYEPA